LKPNDCPKFESCSAPICPLGYADGVYLDGEPVCFYVRQVAKGEAASIELEAALLEKAEKSLQIRLRLGNSDYQKQIRRAAQSPSKRSLIASASAKALCKPHLTKPDSGRDGCIGSSWHVALAGLPNPVAAPLY